MLNSAPIQSNAQNRGHFRITSRVIFESSHDYCAYISQAGGYPAPAPLC